MPKGYRNSDGKPHTPPRHGFVPPPPPLRPVLFPIGPSLAYVALTKGQYAVIDVADADYVGRWNWIAHYNKSTKNYRAMRVEYLGQGKVRNIMMHSDLLGLHGRFQNADHVNPSRSLDNRRSNLRAASPLDQARNRRKYRNNSSGVKGVHRDGQKWVARVQVNGQRILLGRYSDIDAARDAYATAAHKYFGAFAQLG